MELRVAERVVRTGLLRRRRRYRVDLHGVSVFGPGDEHSLIRWERMERIVAGGDDVTVESATATVVIPRTAFGLAPAALAAHLEEARAIERRGQVIAELAGG